MMINRLSLIAAAAFALGACASSTPGSGPAAPAPERPTATATPRAPAPAAPAPSRPALLEAPEDWQFLDAQEDGVAGISLARADRELLAGRQARRTVVVAVIDGGVDTTHADLRTFLWANPGERGGTGRDDDGNGYVDDVRGWNFIGGPDGQEVRYDTYEVTREHIRCTRAGGTEARTTRSPDAQQCQLIAQDFERERQEAEQMIEQIRMIGEALDHATPILRRALGTDSLTLESVSNLRPPNAETRQAQRIWMQLAASGITETMLQEAKKEFESRLEYKLNPEFESRHLVGDDYTNLSERHYGNTDVMGSDTRHGTHVAGIIAGMHRGRQGPDGAPAVHVMIVRTVPDGDERDKDVANAIRYAADNGAHIINMSFGKSYSPHKQVVDEAVRYAEARGVLLVHAAGNDGENLATGRNYPTPEFAGGGRASSWIEVGASSWKEGDGLVAPFSNYGRPQVDVFAPGMDILSAVPDGRRERQSGTSMAAPVVSGLAALLMAYYPELSAADVRRIILESAVRYSDRQVLVPGGDGRRAPFGELSGTGAIVNAYEAVRLADRLSEQR